MQEPQRDRDEALGEEAAAGRPDRKRTSLDREPPPAEDPLVRREEAAAAAEAGAIGGPTPTEAADEATRPVVEAGGGEAEGFEESERELAEHAAHGEDRLSPESDAFTPEVEADESSAAYGEPDEIDPTEVVRDP
jgi:hypothetical protein